MAQTEPVPRTPYLQEVIRLAQQIAHSGGERVTIDDLLSAAAFGTDTACRCRLILQRMGVSRFFDEDAFAETAELQEHIENDSATVEFTSDAATVLDRMPYWVQRLGDRSADTAHLLLACMEHGDNRTALAAVGTTINDLVRAAVAIPHTVSPRDRQIGVRAPIESQRRPDRPTPHAFETTVVDDRHFGTVTSMLTRSQIASPGNMSSRIQRHLTQLHILAMAAELVFAIALGSAAIFAAVTVTPWALIWNFAGTRRDVTPLPVRLFLDAAATGSALLIGFPLWPVTLLLGFRVFDLLEERLGLLQARNDVADPTLSPRALRADKRANHRGIGNYLVARVKGNLSTDAAA